MSQPAKNSKPFSESLKIVMAGGDLTREDVQHLFGRIMDGELSEVEKSALLVALACKGETAEEITGAASAMRARFVPIPHELDVLVDTCGTGGDGLGTFNISTAAALVAAGAGAKVAKHGNRSVSSQSGSADVLERVGISLEMTPQQAGRCLSEAGIAFLFAPRLHPAMKEVMPVRRALAVRTLFNVLGPLTNPAGAKRQVMGVYSEHLVEPIANVLLELGSEHALVVHGEGLDELTTTGTTTVGEVRHGKVNLRKVKPEDVGLPRRSIDELAGGDPEKNAALLLSVLKGQGGPLAEVTAYNAGAALYVAGLASDLKAGVETALNSLASGESMAALERLQSFSESAAEENAS